MFMDVRFVARNAVIDDELRDYMRGKMSKLDKFFSRILDNQVLVSFGRGMYNVEVTSNANGVIMRSEENSPDMRKAFDKAMKNIERQIKRHNDYLKDRAQLKTHDVSFNLEGFPEVETVPLVEEEIVKVKRFPLRPMTAKEATMQMDLLGHEFFLFKNVETGAVNVVYRRKNGGFGLLEPID
jgi:putative sigma-54 modulation protein